MSYREDTEDNNLPWQRNKANKLLVRNEVGKTKRSTFNLPPIDHVYGKEPKKDKENAKEVTMTWVSHKESKDEEPPRDFLKLNRNCVREHYISAKEIVHYRSAHPDVLKKVKKGKCGVEMYLPPNEFSYGIANKPSTPIKNIVQLTYLHEQEQILRDHYALIRSEQEKAKKMTAKLNQAGQVHQLSQEEKQKQQGEKAHNQSVALSEFKLERFKNVKPKIQTRVPNNGQHNKDDSKKNNDQDQRKEEAQGQGQQVNA